MQISTQGICNSTPHFNLWQLGFVKLEISFLKKPSYALYVCLLINSFTKGPLNSPSRLKTAFTNVMLIPKLSGWFHKLFYNFLAYLPFSLFFNFAILMQTLQLLVNFVLCIMLCIMLEMVFMKCLKWITDR